MCLVGSALATLSRGPYLLCFFVCLSLPREVAAVNVHTLFAECISIGAAHAAIKVVLRVFEGSCGAWCF